MYKGIVISLVVFISSTVYSQSNSYFGNWLGSIKTSGVQLRIGLNISEKEGIILSKLDSPDQMSFGNSALKTTILTDSILIDFPLLGAKINGFLRNDSLIATFYQAGMKLPLHMHRFEGDLSKPKRPQTPQEPFPYAQKNVVVKTPNKSVKLDGTLTLPNGKGPFPAVVLVSGSGPQNRNEELMQHQPFLVLADYLTRHGIAVLRYDDRGVGKSTGNFNDATTLDFSEDANAVLEFLRKQKKIDPSKIGIIGHSEGGIVAPIVASKNKNVQFIVLMAGPSIPGSKISIDQQELIMQVNDTDPIEIQENIQLNTEIVEYIQKNATSTALQDDLSKYIEELIKKLNYKVPKTTSPKTFAKQTAYTYTTKWMLNFLLLDPQTYLKQLTIPVFATFGEKDLQVSTRANLAPMQTVLASNPKAKIQVFNELNHLFQHATNGSPSEYAIIEETLAPEYLEAIKNWIDQLNK